MKRDNDNYYFEHGDFLVLQECPDDVGGWWCSLPKPSPIYPSRLSTSITSARKSYPPSLLGLSESGLFLSHCHFYHTLGLPAYLFVSHWVPWREEFYLSCVCPLNVVQCLRCIRRFYGWMDGWTDNSNEYPTEVVYIVNKTRVVLWSLGWREQEVTLKVNYSLISNGICSIWSIFQVTWLIHKNVKYSPCWKTWWPN